MTPAIRRTGAIYNSFCPRRSELAARLKLAPMEIAMTEVRLPEQTPPAPQFRPAFDPSESAPDISHAPLGQRYAAGKALRDKCPRRSHAGWKPPADRRDPVELVLEAEKGRLPDLLPLRHGR